MIVYSLHPDRINKKFFVMSDNYKLQRIRDFDTGEKRADNWNPPGIRWFDDDGRSLKKYKDPDITYISHRGSLIVSPHTHNLIGSTINDVAELLPLSFNNEIWYLLNVFNQIDASDKENSRYKIYSTGKIGWLIKPAFFAEKLPRNKLFKIPLYPAIYYSEDQSDNNENNFKTIVEKNNLFGIEFVKVWED